MDYMLEWKQYNVALQIPEEIALKTMRNMLLYTLHIRIEWLKILFDTGTNKTHFYT